MIKGLIKGRTSAGFRRAIRDLMEEFRPLLADRLALALVNRQQVKPSGFTKRDGGAIHMDDATRRTVLSAYQQRKREEVTHVLLDQGRVGQTKDETLRLLVGDAVTVGEEPSPGE